jgi:Fur family transcriptional regulator, peroxide stress response regulator
MVAIDMSDISSRLLRISAQLEAVGRRITPQRLAICEALLAHGGHPTAAEIYQQIYATHPAISQATVYNTLTMLVELGVIRPLDILGDDHAHYDLCVEPHVNAVCTQCGRIADIHTDTLEALLGLVAARSGYQLAAGDGVIVYGVCAECQHGPATA